MAVLTAISIKGYPRMREEQTSTGSKTSSYFNLIALIAVLVIAPLISWIYLKKGVEYRKSALETLTPKSLDSETLGFIKPFIKPDGQAKLIYLPRVEQDMTLVYEVDDRIIEKPLFDLIIIGDTSAISKPQKINNLSFQQNDIAYKGPYDYVLLDTGNVVRATYINNDDVAKEIIRHLSIVIPMQKKKSIKLERQKTEE